jgi:hypothetical protein
MTKTNHYNAAEILRMMDGQQVDLFYEGLEGLAHDKALEVQDRSRLAEARAFVTATDEGVFVLTDKGEALVARYAAHTLGRFPT